MPQALVNLLCVVNFFVGIILIYIITIQESKNDGLQGQIGSSTTSSFKGKAGREEKLNVMTRNVGIIFFSLSILIAIAAAHS